jgi:hypothetical protein
MKTILALCVMIWPLCSLAASSEAGKTWERTPTTAPAQNIPASQPAGTEKEDGPGGLKQKLLGTWYGPDCGGDYNFKPDGTFDLNNFTPSQNTLSGTWSIRWDALPPTLVVTCKSSDFTKKDPTRPEYAYLRKPQEFKILELNGDALSLLIPTSEWITHYTRKAGEGGFVTRK